MKNQHSMKPQGRTCILRVDNIHCDGCKGKVRKLLMKIDGVNATSIDVEQGKVVVTGNVDPPVLIRKLEKSGKHAEIWRGSNISSIQFDAFNNQFTSLQMGSAKGWDNKSQIKHQPSAKDMKGSSDFKVNDQKTVRFDLSKKAPDFDDFSEEDEYFDDDDGDFLDDDGYFDEDDDDEEFGYGGDQQHHRGQKKMMPKNGKPVGKEKKKAMGKKAKKAGGGFMAMVGEAIRGKRKGKTGNAGIKGGGKKNKGGEIQNHGGGKGKIGTKTGGGVGGKGMITNIPMKKGRGGGKNGTYSDFEVGNHRKGGGGRGSGMGQYRNVSSYGPPAPQMINMNRGGRGGSGGGGNGFYPGVGGVGPIAPAGGAGVGPMMPACNPYQQQQYMAMMMNQQRMMNGGGGGDMMYHPVMYGRPPPGYGYVPPMVPPSPAPAYHHEPYTHMFSDESTESCSIM